MRWHLLFAFVFTLTIYHKLVSTVTGVVFHVNPHENKRNLELQKQNESGYPPNGTVFGQTTSGSRRLKWTAKREFTEGCDGQQNTTDTVCIISKAKFSLHHAAHAALVVFPCWSLFMDAARADRNATVPSRRVVLMQDGDKIGPYGMEVFKAAGAIVMKNATDSEPVLLCGNGSVVTGLDPQAWFESGDDAGLLRDVVLGQHHINERVEPDALLRIGLLNRGASAGRNMVYVEEIATAIKDVCYQREQACALNITTFDGLKLWSQAHYIYSHDVIITPHGNQATNIAFARPCTVFLELFPAGYFLNAFFQPLAYDAKALPFLLYAEPAEHSLIYAERDVAKKAHLNFTGFDIIRNWDDMMTAREECLYALQ